MFFLSSSVPYYQLIETDSALPHNLACNGPDKTSQFPGHRRTTFYPCEPNASNGCTAFFGPSTQSPAQPCWPSLPFSADEPSYAQAIDSSRKPPLISSLRVRCRSL